MARKNEITCKIDKIAGNKIEKLRLSMGLSRAQLGEKIDVTHQQLQKYERGSNRISFGRMCVIAKVLHKPLSYFCDEPESELPSQCL